MKKQPLGDLIANAVSHGIGVIFSITAFIVMIIKADTSYQLIGGIIFGLSLIILYSASTLYHAFPESMHRVLAVFKRLDHSAIYILIAGTYTPFIVILAPITQGFILLVSLWIMAILGIVMKAIWIKKYQYFHLVIYVVMGWSIMFVWSDMAPLIPSVVRNYLILGGLSYTLGIIFYINRFRYAHLVWHLFVLSGSVLHFISIYYLL